MAGKKKDQSDIKKREDSYFAAGRRKRKRYMKIIIPVVTAVVALSAVSAILFPIQPNSSSYGPVGSAHEHAAFLVKLDGVPIDFSQSRYQVKSNLIHVENEDGTTLHRHATDVPFGEFLRSVDMDIRNGCFIGDNGREYCDTADKKLRYFVNETQLDSIADFVPNENDRLLVIYGDENDTELQQEIETLGQIPIRR